MLKVMAVNDWLGRLDTQCFFECGHISHVPFDQKFKKFGITAG